MPFPIKTVRELSEHNEIFDYDKQLNGLSTLQQQFLNDKDTVKAHVFNCDNDSDEDVKLLEIIGSNEAEIVNAANEISLNKKSEKYYFVPKNISDNDLLKLKTKGLVVGSGRSVIFTSKAREAIKSKWLNEKNALMTQKTKNKFDYANFKLASKQKSKKFTRL